MKPKNFFDLNNNGKYDWWEYLIPVIILILIEVIAELLVGSLNLLKTLVQSS